MTLCRVLITALLILAPLASTPAQEPVPLDLPPKLGEELASLERDRLFRDSDVAVHVVDVETGEEIFAHDADRGLNPASTMKVLTTAAALRTLGPSYRFTTGLYTDGRIDSSGVLRGNLYVKGGGDPSLVVEKLWKMVYDLDLEGVERISGDVIYDEGFLGTDYDLPGWSKKEDIERGPSYFPKIGALSLNFNTVALVIGPGEEVGSEARVRLETPADSYVTIDNQVTTGATDSWRMLEIERPIEPGAMAFTLTGSWPLDAEARKYYRAVGEPTAHFMAAFEEMLSAQDVRVTGRHRRGETPERADPLVVLRSPSLAAVLMDMNKFSNNFMAELVLRTMGAEVHGMPGTTDKGLLVIRDYLVELGFEEDEFTLVNGSGLTRDAYISPRQLTAVMVDMAADPHVGHEFVSSLAIAGRDGTLWRRLRDEPGRLRGKTGTIDGIHCLTGYVEGGDGRLYAFGFLVNDVRGSISKVKTLHDDFAHRVFDYAVDQPEVVDQGGVEE